MTQTGIANLVLSHLGAAPITSIGDATVEAEAIRDCWDAVRDGLLRAHRWNFAKARAYLTPVVYGESFALPTDCLRVIRVNGVDQSGPLDDGAEIEGRTLRLAATMCEVVYLRIVPNPDDWDSLFTLAFGYELAAAVGPRLANGSQSLASDMRTRGAEQLAIAMAANAIETRPTVRRATDGSRYLDAVYGPRRPQQPAPPAKLLTQLPTVTITIVQGGDGAWYERTAYSDGRSVYKLLLGDVGAVSGAIPSSVPILTLVTGSDGALYEETLMPNGGRYYKPVFLEQP
jgi:hypothetical protein